MLKRGFTLDRSFRSNHGRRPQVRPTILGVQVFELIESGTAAHLESAMILLHKLVEFVGCLVKIGLKCLEAILYRIGQGWLSLTDRT